MMEPGSEGCVRKKIYRPISTAFYSFANEREILIEYLI